jgi:hypothetical protein
MNIYETAENWRRVLARRLRGKAKALRKEQIADLFLQHLSKKGIDGADAILLNFLDDNNIYYDIQSLQEVIELLLEKNLIKEVPNTMAAVGYFDETEPVQDGIPRPAAWLSSIEGMIKQSEITLKGRNFIKKGQKLDVIGLAEAKAKKDKRRERIVTFIIALATAVGVTLLTEPIKIIVAELAKSAKNRIHESSPVRPRQKPESRKPTDAAAPRG